MGRIDDLLATMTLEEKIGQLNMAAGSGVVTGPGERRALQDGVRAGRIGSVLNLWVADEVHALQRLAVECTPPHSFALRPRRITRTSHDLSGPTGRSVPVRS
jgi:hypothetical protein